MKKVEVENKKSGNEGNVQSGVGETLEYWKAGKDGRERAHSSFCSKRKTQFTIPVFWYAIQVFW